MPVDAVIFSGQGPHAELACHDRRLLGARPLPPPADRPVPHLELLRRTVAWLRTGGDIRA
ncbi:hypothetical protein ABZU53_29095 [Micromonospora sp. NPDC005194]|uniref:hypothetical protein n=1 Tax=Micromonospora sp. NPDC005194 TaxID=3156870 RepID=UPI0033B0FD7C